MLDWQGSGMSVMEIATAARSTSRSRPGRSRPARASGDSANYKVLFCKGGLGRTPCPDEPAARQDQRRHHHTGEWTKKSIKESAHFCKVNVAASAEASNFTCVPNTKPEARPERRLRAHLQQRDIGGVEYHGCLTPARCRWWPTCPRTSCRAPSSEQVRLIFAVRRRTIGPAGSPS